MFTNNDQWKKALFEGTADIIEHGPKKTADMDEEAVRELHAKIGELAAANDLSPESSSPGRASEAQHDRARTS